MRHTARLFSGSRNGADDQRVTLAATTAQCCRAKAKSAPLQLMRNDEHQAGAAGTKRMAERHSPTVDVHAVLVELEHAGGVERDGCESFVDIDQVQVGGREV